FEPGLDELLLKHGGKTLRATLDHSEAINNTDITFILVATPSTPDGSFSNRFIESSLISLGEALSKSKKDHHLFVISSTVLPESTDKVFIPLLEKITGRELNKGFSVCYDPDFVALGNVIKGFLQPDLVIIGESSPEAGEIVEAIHRQMCENTPVISRMSIINAELAKVCLNTYITVKISFANSIANLCERVPGADVDSVTKAIGVDKRISPYYFQGGLAFGGTCFPRDVKAFITLAEKYGAQAELIYAVEKINKQQNQHLVEVVLRELETSPNKTVGIIGLAFTNNTPVITESPAIKLIDELIKRDIRVLAYDPLAIENTRNIFGSQVEYVHSVESCLTHVNLAVITLRNQQIKKAVESFVVKNPLTIIDCWRMIDADRLNKTLIKYVPIGRYLEENQ
ncbi:MAG: UDP-glucose/GDP-mannose dehydrogenase family protein, partial [Acidobacteria bacterium]